jgi:hypothetical protein
LNFNHHEVIPQLPEGQHHDAQHHITAKQLHCAATSLSRQGKSHRGRHLEFCALRNSNYRPWNDTGHGSWVSITGQGGAKLGAAARRKQQFIELLIDEFYLRNYYEDYHHPFGIVSDQLLYSGRG